MLPGNRHPLELATLEPVWAVLDPASNAYWGSREDAGLGLFSYGLADPFFFLAAAGLLLVGSLKRWLSSYEILLGAALLLMAYVGRGHEMCMTCSARYAVVAFPIYLVLGKLLVNIRPALAVGFLALSGFWLGVYSAMFSAWYRVF